MDEKILVARGREVTTMPRERWEADLAEVPEKARDRLDFMTDEHHLVRRFVVRELPRIGEPIGPEVISRSLNLSPRRTAEILDELEARLFFLVRNEEGKVSWTFPVTVEKTGHQLIFDTGERLDGA